VTGDSDEADEAFLARLDRRLQRSLFPQCELPLDHVDEVVQLEEIDVFHAESFERAPDLVPRAGVVALARLRREEDLGAMLPEPRREPQLRVPV
jgi:hypothetical protein